MEKIGVLFVCLGNICRSPLAEGIFKDQIEKRKIKNSFTVDSAGTAGYHIGKKPDDRTIKVAKNHGIELHHLGRKINSEDLINYKHVIVMDESNFEDVHALYYETLRRIPDGDKLFLIRDYDPEVRGVHSVPDPFYENEKAFENVYDILNRSIKILIDHFVDKYGIRTEEDKGVEE